MGRGTAPAPELEAAFRFLGRLRCYLHCQSGRDNNALSFDAQDAIAELWRDGDAARWMREYYRHARVIYRAAIRALDSSEAQFSSLFAQFRDWRSRVANADFSVHRERVHFRAPQRLDVEPELALSLFEFVARHGIRLSFEAEQQIESRLAAPARALRRAAARVARAEPDPLASARAAGRPGDARNRRAGRHFSGDGADRMPGDPRLLSPLHGGRAHPGRHAEPQDPAGGL